MTAEEVLPPWLAVLTANHGGGTDFRGRRGGRRAENRVRLQAMLAGATVVGFVVVTAVAAQAGLDASSIAAAQSDTPERTWLGWSSGFVPAFVVIGAAYLLVRLIRRRRDNTNAD